MSANPTSRRHFLRSIPLAAGGFLLAGSSGFGQFSSPGRVALGIDHLERQDFAPVRGKRAGLLTHRAGVNREGRSTIEVLGQAPGSRLLRLFGPEHGIHGRAPADNPVGHQTHPETGLPVYSLYGDTRKPTPEMLRGLDVLVIDLQDLGVRSYTYVSAMKLAMEACFEQGVEVLVLDRPNPLGGFKTSGPMIEERWRSYVGAFPVPYVHGLTIAEIARIAAATPGWLNVSEPVRRGGRLTIIPMLGWRRAMLWTRTGLPWIPTSPNIPDLSSVLGYAMIGLGGQLGGFRHGIGTEYPFRLLTFPGVSTEGVRAALSRRLIAGLDYRSMVTRTREGRPFEGVYVHVTGWEHLIPTEISFHMMVQACAWSATNPFREASEAQATLFNKHVGSTAWWEEITTHGESARVDSFVGRWTHEARLFHQSSRNAWMYD